jgi:hypothetical protein
VQTKEACDEENDDDDADDVENVHWVLRLRQAHFQYESTVLQQERPGPQVSSTSHASPGRRVVNFIQTDVANGRTIDSAELAP